MSTETQTEEAYWFTLGQDHTHRINGMTFDCDAVIEIAGDYGSARERMVELCGVKWSHQYDKGKLDLGLFPRGVHVLS